MPNLVTQTAMLQCSFGSAPCSLMVTNVTKTQGEKKLAANIMTNKAYADIPGFATCTSPSNPVVISTGSPAPCTPVFGAPWAPGEPTVLIEKFPALTNTSTLTCNYASGVITVTNPGATTVMVG